MTDHTLLQQSFEHEVDQLRVALAEPNPRPDLVADDESALAAQQSRRRLRRRRRTRLAELQAALDRLQRGCWGRCQDCDEDIAEAELAADPVRRRCPACEQPVS